MADPSVPPATHGLIIFRFTYPTTKKVDLPKVFRLEYAISKENLSKTSSLRDEVVAALDSGNTGIIISSIERYLPHLFGFAVSVESNQKIRLNSPLTYSWTSIFGKPKSYHTYYTFRYELVMILIAYAIAHINRAVDIISVSTSDSFEENSKKSATSIRNAAGILDYIQLKEIPRWSELPSDRPVEINTSICQSLSDYCVSQAQCLTIKKGLLGGTSKSTLAKLAMDVWNKSLTMDKTFKSLPKDTYKDLLSQWKNYLQFNEGLSKCYVYKYMGENSYAESKYGAAVSYLNAASDTLKQVTSNSVLTSMATYKKEIDEVKDDVEHVKRSYTNENNHIYYQPLIELNQLELPESKALMTPTPWVPPAPAYSMLQ